MNILKNYSHFGIKPATIALLTKVTPLTVSRKIATDGYDVIIGSTERKKLYSPSVCHKLSKSILGNKFPQIKDKIQVFYNFKGGTGKTTTCYQTACILSILGFKVLAIDLDPQSHLSGTLQFPEGEKYKTMFDVMINGYPIEKAIFEIYEGLHAIPSNLGLTMIEAQINSKTRREDILGKVLKPLKENYDFILIDTNPTISTSNLNALHAADHINVICETQPYSLSGLSILIDQIESLEKELDKEFKYTILPNKYESKTAIAQEILGALRIDYKENTYQTVIRKSEDLNNSAKLKLPIVAIANNKSNAFEDFLDFCNELVEKSSLKKVKVNK
jgi:chromosome partitioning protein